MWQRLLASLPPDHSGIIVPIHNPFGDEVADIYGPNRDRLPITAVTGFRGLRGTLAIMRQSTGRIAAALFVDPRYPDEARAVIPPELGIEILNIVEPSPMAKLGLEKRTVLENWLWNHAARDQKIIIDLWLITEDEYQKLKNKFRGLGIQFVSSSSKALRNLWTERPEKPVHEIYRHDLKYAGATPREKIRLLQAEMKDEGISAFFSANAECAAWLLNIRGDDEGVTPVPHSYVGVDNDGNVTLLVERRKIEGIEAKLQADVPGLQIINFDPEGNDKSLFDYFAGLKAAGKKLGFDPSQAPRAVAYLMEKADLDTHRCPDLIAAAKVAKNPVELAGMRRAQLAHGQDLIRLLAEIDATWDKNDGWTESAVVNRLIELNESSKKRTGYRSQSFNTISGSNANSAKAHYKAESGSDKKLSEGIYTIDCGAQYKNGTTDITRSIALGKPTAQMRKDYTFVLKSHLVLAMGIFSMKMTGEDLHNFAHNVVKNREGAYGHGTGHGVGCFLGVHEIGPCMSLIYNRGRLLVPNMVISVEPGIYKEGEYGIRLENLYRIVDKGDGMMGFEVMAYVPFDRDLIDETLLTAAEIKWLDHYHAKCRELNTMALGSDGRAAAWLDRNTQPLSKNSTRLSLYSRYGEAVPRPEIFYPRRYPGFGF